VTSRGNSAEPGEPESADRFVTVACATNE